MQFSVKLKILDLSFCKHLKETPNLSMLPYLEKLDLQSCTNLVEVHPSIEFHERLVELTFRNCKNLKRLATRINLKSLKRLSLYGCSKFEKFPEIEGDMECLEDLELGATAIKELHPSLFKHLKGLKSLSLMDCTMLGNLTCNIGERKSLEEFLLEGTAVEYLPPSVEQLKGLATLDLRNCKKFESLPNYVSEMKCLSQLYLSDTGIKKLPSSIAQSTSLEVLEWSNCDLDEESILNLPHSLWYLNLGGNNFVSLPESFTQLTKLTSLSLGGCLSLQTLDSLPSSIHIVSAAGCVSLERYWIPACEGNLLNSSLFDFSECHKLVENDGKNKPNIYYSESELEEICCQTVLPGSEIPSCFSHIYESESESGEEITWVCLRMDMDPNFFRYLKEVSVCALFGIDHQPSDDDDDKPFNYKDEIVLEINGRCVLQRAPIWDWIYRIKSDHIMLFHAPNFFEWMCNSDGFYIEASLKTGSYSDGRPWKVKKWGIHPLMDTQDEDDDEDEDEEEDDEDDDEDEEEDDEDDDEDEDEDVEDSDEDDEEEEEDA